MEDPKSKKSGREGVGAPAKGDSSAGNTPLNPMEGATISDAPVPLSPPAPVKPPTRVANPDATISDNLAAATSSTGRGLAGMYMRETVLQPGDLIGARYEIVALLGEGGMGAVYKALDREVERTVALKLIRPELASNPAILARFKQELLTAHQVTHKNVIRIYDIAEADGVKFITMEFVEGQDLRHILVENGKLPIEKAVEIIRQVCYALEAAHSAGIIHRDLKPQNIMQESKTGRILVMDFGLARTIGGDGMTQTGALLGTIEYMSPEQSMGKTLDQRSDIFTIGLIFYELLVGNTPYKADTAMASLLRRNQERAVPAAELDSSVPKALSDIVAKCLERELENRYQSVQEILHDLDAFQGARPTLASISMPGIIRPKTKPAVPWKWIGVGTLAIVVIGGGWVLKSVVMRPSGTGGAAAVKGPELSLAILPFQNASGDSALDWLGASLAEMLSTDVGQSAHMRTVSPDRMHQIFNDLRLPPNSDIDPDTQRRVAELSNADTIVSGKYVKFGDKIHIEATVQDLKHDRRVPLKIDATSEKEIPGTVDQLAELIRQNLSVSADVVKELKVSSFQPSSNSVDALKAYNQGMQLFRDGKNLEAVQSFQNAVQADPQFALAFSRLAEADSALGYMADAETNSRKAQDLSGSLPVAEKYLIEAIYARTVKNNQKAIAAYENLAKIMPDDSNVEAALGSLYSENGQYDKARAEFAKILQADPKNTQALWQMGVVEITNGNPQAALDPLSKGLNQAIEVDNQEQRALIQQSIGVCYRLLNKPDEAMRNYQESIEIAKRLGLKRLQAASLSEMATLQNSLGKPDAAMSSYSQALQLLQDIGMKKEYGTVLLNRGVLLESRGDYDKALQDYKDSLQIQRDADDQNLQALCLSNIGGVYLQKGDTDNALTYLNQALPLREKLNNPEYLARTLDSLGDVYVAMGDFDKALESLLKALDISRKANITPEVASASESLGMVFFYQGRLGAAVSSMQDAVKGYRAANNYSGEMADSLNGYAFALAHAGRADEASAQLTEAQNVAKSLKDEGLQAKMLLTKGDVAFYGGDLKGARAAYEQSAALSAKEKDKEGALIAKMNLARVSMSEGRAQLAISDLRGAVQQADLLHSKYYAVRGSVDLAEALIMAKDYTHARTELDHAQSRSEKMGLRMENARIHYLNGKLLSLTGKSGDATSQYQQAKSILADIMKENGAEKLLQRQDLKAMYDEDGQGTAPKS
ncbi:MAG: tetratricopeptide repeat protein [Candidatus Acidiferrum sp.]